jgi:hypothetical protein
MKKSYMYVLYQMNVLPFKLIKLRDTANKQDTVKELREWRSQIIYCWIVFCLLMLISCVTSAHYLSNNAGPKAIWVILMGVFVPIFIVGMAIVEAEKSECGTDLENLRALLNEDWKVDLSDWLTFTFFIQKNPSWKEEVVEKGHKSLVQKAKNVLEREGRGEDAFQEKDWFNSAQRILVKFTLANKDKTEYYKEAADELVRERVEQKEKTTAPIGFP